MKSPLSLLIVSFLMYPFLLFSQLTLEPVEGVEGGTVNCIYTTADGTTFVGTHGGIYKWNTATEKWESKSNGINFSGWQCRINGIIEVKGVLFAGSTYMPGVYVSKNQGETWEVTKIFSGEYEVGYIESFVKAEKDGKEILYAISAYNFYKSEDGGETWNTVTFNWSGIGSPLAVSEDGDLYCGSGGSGLSMFKASLENDSVWGFFQATFESGTHSQILCYGADTVFTIFKGYDGVFVLLQNQNDGAEGFWYPVKAPFGADSTDIRLIKKDEDQNLWAFSGSGSAYQSMDGGATWQSFTADYGIEAKSATIRVTEESAQAVSVLQAVDIKRIGVSTDVELLLGSQAGVHVGKPEGNKINLRGLNRGLNAINIVRGVSHNGVVYGVDERGGIFLNKIPTESNAFEMISTLFPTKTIAVNPKSNALLLGGYEGIAELNFNELKHIEVLGIEQPQISAMHYDDENESLYAGYQEDGTCKIAVSADYGKNWNPFTTIGEFYEPSSIAVYGDQLAVSSTGSASIAFVNKDKPAEVTYELAAWGTWSGFDLVLADKGKLFASGWDGISLKSAHDKFFKRIYEYEPESQNYVNDFDVALDKYLATFSQGVAAYNEELDTWEELNEEGDDWPGESQLTMLIERFKPDFARGPASKSATVDEELDMYVSFNYGGLWKVTGHLETASDDIMADKMAAIYPNPSRGNATLFFQVNQKQTVKINIYSMGGQLVKVLANQELPTGNYRYTWDGKGSSGTQLPNGQYLVQFVKGNLEETQTLILNR